MLGGGKCSDENKEGKVLSWVGGEGVEGEGGISDRKVRVFVSIM